RIDEIEAAFELMIAVEEIGAIPTHRSLGRNILLLRILRSAGIPGGQAGVLQRGQIESRRLVRLSNERGVPLPESRRQIRHERAAPHGLPFSLGGLTPQILEHPRFPRNKLCDVTDRAFVLELCEPDDL